jgi:capsular exopolysaccharide synthesis family protein
MSRNFELLKQAERERRRAPILELAPDPVTETKEEDGKGFRRDRLNLDRLAQEESLKLVQRVFLRQAEESPRMVVFAGIDHGNGCTRICASAAVTLANNISGSVCVVDANLRSPALPDVFGVNNHYGLTDALQKDGPIQDFVRRLHPANLCLLSCGSLPFDACNFLDLERLKVRLTALHEEFDYVAIDAPPLNHYADAMAVGRLADGLVLVLEADSTRRDSAASVMETLRQAGVRVLGAVLNKRSFPIPERLYRKL